MAYATGVPSSTTNFINTLINFLVSDGGFALGNTWTFLASSATNPDGTSAVVSFTARALVRDGQYALLCWTTADPSNLFLNTSSNNPTSGRLNAQTNSAASSMRIELGTAPLRHHLFSDGSGTHCAVEWLGGVYQHINIGYATKYGTWVGGVYVTGTYWNRSLTSGSNYYAWDSGYHVRPFDGLDNISAGFGGHIRVNYLSQSIAHFMIANRLGNIAFGLQLLSRYMIDRSPNAYNGRAILAPVELLLGLEDSDNPSYMIPLGRVDNCAYVNLTNLNSLDTILNDWMVFPLSAKNSGGTVVSGYINTLNYGIAYRK